MVFNATFKNILVEVSFIGGGNRSTWRKPHTCRKSLTYNIVSSIRRNERPLVLFEVN
jgi:hypothetical protein